MLLKHPTSSNLKSDKKPQHGFPRPYEPKRFAATKPLLVPVETMLKLERVRSYSYSAFMTSGGLVKSDCSVSNLVRAFDFTERRLRWATFRTRPKRSSPSAHCPRSAGTAMGDASKRTKSRAERCAFGRSSIDHILFSAFLRIVLVCLPLLLR